MPRGSTTYPLRPDPGGVREDLNPIAIPDASPFFTAGSKLGYSLINGSNYVSWDSASFDATNVTLSFTKVGAPTGTDALQMLVFF